MVQRLSFTEHELKKRVCAHARFRVLLSIQPQMLFLVNMAYTSHQFVSVRKKRLPTNSGPDGNTLTCCRKDNGKWPRQRKCFVFLLTVALIGLFTPKCFVVSLEATLFATKKWTTNCLEQGAGVLFSLCRTIDFSTLFTKQIRDSVSKKRCWQHFVAFNCCLEKHSLLKNCTSEMILIFKLVL